MAYPHLSKAPIVEGLIDFQVGPRQGLTPDVIAPIHESLKGRYGPLKELLTFQGGIEIKDGVASSNFTPPEKIGFRLEGSDAPFVVLARTNGLTVSRLAPYDNWENLLSEARFVWDAYCKVAMPETIVRIGVRFINRINLPLANLEFENYLTAGPVIPRALPQVIGQFITRLVVHDKEARAVIAIVQATEQPNETAGMLPLLIDIDAFTQDELPASSGKHWEIASVLRNLKNAAFFSSITDRTLGMLK